jgi:hypothetical protein
MTFKDQGAVEERPRVDGSICGRPPAKYPRTSLAVASCALGVVAALCWLSLPVLEKSLSLGEPFGSMFFVVPALVVAVLVTCLGTACGIGCLLRGASGSRKRRIILALAGISLSLGTPVLVWIIAVVWL